MPYLIFIIVLYILAIRRINKTNKKNLYSYFNIFLSVRRNTFYLNGRLERKEREGKGWRYRKRINSKK